MPFSGYVTVSDDVVVLPASTVVETGRQTTTYEVALGIEANWRVMLVAVVPEIVIEPEAVGRSAIITPPCLSLESVV